MTSEPSGIPGEFEEEDWVLVHLNGVRKGREAERAKIVAWLRRGEGLISRRAKRREPQFWSNALKRTTERAT